MFSSKRKVAKERVTQSVYDDSLRLRLIGLSQVIELHTLGRIFLKFIWVCAVLSRECQCCSASFISR